MVKTWTRTRDLKQDTEKHNNGSMKIKEMQRILQSLDKAPNSYSQTKSEVIVAN